jgi:hypothetical protein
MTEIKMIVNNFKEIRIKLFAELDIQRITKQELNEEKSVLCYSNGLIFNYLFSETNPEDSDEIIRFEYFYYTKSEKIDSSRWNGYTVEVHDLTNVPLFEFITKNIQENKE